MTIDVLPLDRNPKIPESPRSVVTSPVISGTAVATGTQSASTPVSPGEVNAAVQQLQAAISKGPNPAFSLDYLSGLSVVTVRSTITGEVVFQLPDTRAVELARLIKSGASVSSIGLLNTTA